MLDLQKNVMTIGTINRTIEAYYLDGNHVYGHYIDQKGKVDFSEWVQHDIVNGVTRSVIPQIQTPLSFNQWIVGIDSNVRMRYRQETILKPGSPLVMKVEQEYEQYLEDSELPLCSEIGLSLLASLISSRVEGSKIVQWLKTKGVDIDIKFTKAHVGGWIFDPIQTVEELVTTMP